MRCFVLVASLLAAGAASAEDLRLVDDRGEAVEAPLRVCFVQDLETDCHDLEDASAAPVALRPFDLLRVEGPRHGPVTVRAGDLATAEDGARRLVVPRKARLRIAGLPEGPATLSLYPVDDPEARRPSARFDLEPEPETGSGPSADDGSSAGFREVHVPAGVHLVSISRAAFAPDLHALAAPPGSSRSLAYRERTGWSLALRAVDPETGDPVPGATIGLQPPPGPEEDAPDLPTAETGPLGFALFGGLAPPMVHATVRHGEFVVTDVLGLSAAPGTFDLRHAVLQRGGTVEVRVSIDGEPAARAVCRIVEENGRNEKMNPVIETVLEAETDESGFCRLERVAPGSRFLRVLLPREGSAAVVDRRVQVMEGVVTPFDLDLSPIRLSGTVYHGEEAGGPGYLVMIDLLRAEGPAGLRDPAVTVGTGESGEYDATLWTPAEYLVQLISRVSTGLGAERIYLSDATEELDFHLSAREVRGRVVDPEGEPVPEAYVSFSWNRRYHTGTWADAQGEFSVPLPSDEGEAVLDARRKWEPASESVSLTIAEGVPVPPVTLVVPASERSGGRLVTSGGAAIAGGTVWSYRLADTGVPLLLGRSPTGPDGSFRVPLAPDGPTLLYTTGPGCPLTLGPATPAAADQEIDLRCSDTPSAVRLRMLDGEGDGLSGHSLILRAGELVIPSEVLAEHLTSLGLPAESDGQGRLVLAGVSPGTYDLYLRASSNEFTVAQGLRHGFVATTSLAPLAATDLEIVVDEVQ